MRGLWAARGLAGADLDTLPRLRNPRPWQRALEQHGATSLNFLSFWNHSLSDSDFKLQSLILCEIRYNCTLVRWHEVKRSDASAFSMSSLTTSSPHHPQTLSNIGLALAPLPFFFVCSRFYFEKYSVKSYVCRHCVDEKLWRSDLRDSEPYCRSLPQSNVTIECFRKLMPLTLSKTDSVAR